MATNVIQVVQGDYPPDLPYTLTNEVDGSIIDLTAADHVDALCFSDAAARVLIAGWPRTCGFSGPRTGGGVTIPLQAGDTSQPGTFDFEFHIYWVGGRDQTTVVRALLNVQANPNLTPIAQAAAGITAAEFAAVGSGNQVLASPNGSGGTPAFRTLVAADLSSLTRNGVRGPVVELTTPSATYTMSAADGSVWVEAANVTVVLPLPAGLSGYRFTVRNRNQTSTSIKTPSSGATLNDQDYSASGLPLGGAYDSLEVETNGTVYGII